MNIIHEGDIVLVDKGFCDVVNFLITNKKLHVYCPGLGQLDTIEAKICHEMSLDNRTNFWSTWKEIQNFFCPSL